MNDEMKNLFLKLNTNEKRNEFSALLVKLDKLINELIIQNNIDIKLPNVKNYDSINQANQSEEDALMFFYDDVWNLKTKILTLLMKSK